ncbi:MAG TPA: glutathione S-transferase family protein [Saliniramus sp.]|nr:glutathione S-transferase family protein [Saliniramus sp.]
MTDELVFYTNPMSRGRIVRWMLEEVGRPYRTQIIHYGPAMKSAEYRAINPMGKVPALVYNGAVVTEVAAICAWLADAFPEAGLAPAPDDPARAPYLRWLFFAAGPLEAAVTNKSLGVVVPEERRGMVGYGSFEDVMDTLEYALSQGDYVAGDRFSAADVYLGAQVQWGLMFGTIDKRPAFERYAERLSARAAAIRANELDDAAMPPQA